MDALVREQCEQHEEARANFVGDLYQMGSVVNWKHSISKLH